MSTAMRLCLERLGNLSGLELGFRQRHRVEPDHAARRPEHFRRVTDRLRELLHAARRLAGLAEGATVQQAALDGARVLGRVAIHRESGVVRALGRLQGLVRGAAELIGVGAHQERGHGLGMLVAQAVHGRRRPPPARRRSAAIVVSLIDFQVRLVLQRDDEIFGESAFRGAQHRQQPPELGAHLFRSAAKAMHGRHQHARPQRLGVIGAESARAFLDGLGQHLVGRGRILQRQQARADDVQQLHAQRRPVVQPAIGADPDLLQPIERRQGAPAGVVGAGVAEQRDQEIPDLQRLRFLGHGDVRLPRREARPRQDGGQDRRGCGRRRPCCGRCTSTPGTSALSGRASTG